MYIDDWFQSLTQRIKAIEHEWPKASENRKQELLSKLWELRHASDSVVDLWLQYEEKLSNVMKHIAGELSDGEQTATDGQGFGTPFGQKGTGSFGSGMSGSKNAESFGSGTTGSKSADSIGNGIAGSKSADAFGSGMLGSKNADLFESGTSGSNNAASSGSGAQGAKDAAASWDKAAGQAGNSGVSAHAGVKSAVSMSDKADAPEVDAANRYRKGEGFFHLRLYEQARGYFHELVAEAPDWETGRLYYAYSLLFCQEKEAAMREFRLLGKTAASKKVAAISCNALGCMLAEEGKWLEARQAFCETLANQPENTQAMYNMALSHLHDGEPEEALEILDLYLSSDPDDWEAHIAWLHAAKSIAAKANAWIKETPPRLQLPIRQLDVSVVYEIALFFEANGQNQRAYHCFRHLTERFPADDAAWHGMAWNAWLLHGADRALPLLKKAISLAPDKLDYLFSYGWLLLFNGEESKAASAFRFMLTKDVSNHLAKAGLIVASERLGDYPLAEMLADSLRSHSEAYLRALGNYHLGRLAAIQEQWSVAEEYFVHATEIPEAALFLAICRDMQETAGMANSKQEYHALMPNVTLH